MQISVTTFLDYVAATGTTRLRRVVDAKRTYGEPYNPASDFYGPLRKRIVQIFEGERADQEQPGEGDQHRCAPAAQPAEASRVAVKRAAILRFMSILSPWGLSSRSGSPR